MTEKDANKKDDVQAAQADTPKAKPQTAVSGRTIEEYRDELGTDASTFAGVKQRERWPAQRRVTRRTYEKAVEDFLGGKTYGVGK